MQRIENVMMKEALTQIVNRLKQEEVRHEINRFDSGCSMIDIWIGDLLYVIQIEPEMIGLSLVDDNTGWFDTIPDKAYRDFDHFKIDFEDIFKLKMNRGS